MSSRHNCRSLAFTLLELLVAVAVLCLMFLSLAQILSTVNRVWLHGKSRIDHFTKSRAIMELIAGDLQRAVFRADCPSFGVGSSYYLTNGSPASLQTAYTNAFYTRFASGRTGRDLALVSYSIAYSTAKTPDAVYLQRSHVAIPWNNSTAKIPFQGDLATQLSQTVPHEAAPGVICLRFVFRLKDGTLVGPGTGKNYTGYNPENPVTTVGVALAVINERALIRMSMADVKNLQSLLENAPLGTTESIKVAWDQVLNAYVFGKPGYPADMAVQLKTFERWVSCQSF